jgi:hypothetical protein
VVTVHPFSFPPHPKENALALLIGLSLLTGCAPASRGNWSKDGAGPDNLARDRYGCIQESRVPYPTSYGASVASGGTSGWFKL